MPQSAAWDAGYLAAKIGDFLATCPYKLNSKEWSEWMAGYNYWLVGNRPTYAEGESIFTEEQS